ncbi:MAG: hypothetical protein PHE89_00690 [Alphaproteobacteria bacterium]|nr:hypothetical protein [Alphaproteobacteria bacterium]
MYKGILFSLFIFSSIAACSTDSSQPVKTTYDSTYDRFVKNVFIREKTPNSIVYEYRDVRVDEVALLAGKYCQETYQAPAHLQAIRLHKNNSRLATFHCYELQ